MSQTPWSDHADTTLPNPTTLHIGLLGGFRLAYEGAPGTAMRSTRLQALLAYILLHRNAPLPRQQLSFAFWPDSTEAQARNNLRNLLYRLRHDLPDLDRFLQADAQTLQWCLVAPYTLDVQAFETAIAQAEHAKTPTEKRAALESAVQVYQGDLLPSFYDDWVLPERERLRQSYTTALAGLAQLLEQGRDYPAAIDYAQRLLRHAPLEESAYRQLMRLHALNGDRASALDAYRICAEVLERELGIEPDDSTREMYERLRYQHTLHDQISAPVSAASDALPFVGRQVEWAELRAAWDRAARGKPLLALIVGEPGIGKTRLAQELKQWVARQGMRTAQARCYAAEGELAYAPVVDWLRAGPLPVLDTTWLTELSRLLPELLVQHPDLPPPRPMTEAWQRRRLFEALARAILGGSQPLLLALDDIQWCDQETIEWLHYLLRFGPSERLLVIATLRAEEMHDVHPLASCIQALRRDDRLVEIAVGPLDRSDTVTLATNAAGQAPDPGRAAFLYRETEGNPLFVVEMVRAGLPTSPVRSPDELPPRMRETIRARLSRLSAQAGELAGLAATIGREFSFAVLAEASEMGQDDLIRALEELLQRRVAQEQGAGAYDFTHDKLREVAYADLSTPRRRMLHHRVAQALEAAYARDLGSVSARIAAHYERSGEPRLAVPHWLRAASTARQVYANDEASRHYRRVLASIDTTDVSKTTRLEALVGLGQVCVARSQYAEAEPLFREAIALGHETGMASDDLARLHYWVGETLFYQGMPDEMINLAEQGLALLGQDTESVTAALMNHMRAVAYVFKQDIQRHRQASLQAAQYLDRLPYTEELRPAYSGIIATYRRDKEVEKALWWSRALEERAAAHHDLKALAEGLTYAGHVVASTGDWQGALARFRQALLWFTEMGESMGIRWAHLNLGEALLVLGELEEAEGCAQSAVDAVPPQQSQHHLASAHWLAGRVALAHRDWQTVLATLQQAVPATAPTPALAGATAHSLGRASLALGRQQEAQAHFADAMDLSAPLGLVHDLRYIPGFLLFYAPLSGLEAASGDASAFRTLCHRFREQHPETASWSLAQWYLEPATVATHPGDRMVAQDLPTWVDPSGDCGYTVDEGIEIHAANGRDLWHNNLSAPRLLRPASGDLVIQTACTPVSDGRPAIGGLLLWQDEQNYLRLVRGLAGAREITLIGCIDNQDLILGRGQIEAGDSRQVVLRLERSGEDVRALCSADGVDWFTVGQATFPAERPVQIGLHAIGNIDRTIYLGAYPEGTAIRFASFSFWTA